MKPWHFKIFHKLLDEAQPQTIGEIGTHNGRTGVQMCEYMLKNYEHKVVYSGYDAWELISAEESEFEEINGKGVPKDESTARRFLSKMSKRYPNRLKFSLTKGYTIDTIKEPIAFDFVYIDAGHKYESVLHDWNMVNKSKMIVFDDYVLPGVKKVLDLHVSPNNAIEYIPFTDESRAVAVVRNF